MEVPGTPRQQLLSILRYYHSWWLFLFTHTVLPTARRSGRLTAEVDGLRERACFGQCVMWRSRHCCDVEDDEMTVQTSWNLCVCVCVCVCELFRWLVRFTDWISSVEQSQAAEETYVVERTSVIYRALGKIFCGRPSSWPRSSLAVGHLISLFSFIFKKSRSQTDLVITATVVLHFTTVCVLVFKVRSLFFWI